MSSATLHWTTLASILLFSLPGCGFFQSKSTDDVVEITETRQAVASAPSPSTASDHSASAESAPPLEASLELKLKVGDRFPLSKVVQQRMTQSDRGGVSENTSTTNMMLSLVVDELRPDGRKLLTVQYHRVHYEQDIRGKKVTYSSERPSEPIPPEAYLYAGLANNGFSFWLGPNNKVVEIVGFNDFIKRCVRNIPENSVAAVQRQLETMTRDDGIANFIDDGIGLLPYSNDPQHPAVAVKEGTRWQLEPRKSDAPIPMLVTTECMLKGLSLTDAEIMLSGRISGPPNGFTMRSPDGNMKVMVKGGHCTGSCRVDRHTGLPTASRVERYLELAMELPDGQQIQQNKETVSIIRSFLNQSAQADANIDQRVQQTSIRNADSAENHRRVQQAVDQPGN